MPIEAGPTDPIPDALRSAEALLLPDKVLLPDGPVAGYAVHVANGRFREVGPAEAVRAACPHLAPVPLPGRLLMPGFIDAHHHLTQAFGKALAFGEPSEIFRRIWVPLEGSMDADLVQLASRLGALEALRGGFTTVVDAGTRAPGGAPGVAAAAKAVGLRCVVGFICNDFTGADTASILRDAAAHLAAWPDDALIHPSLAVSIPEIATDAMLHAASSLCAEAGAIFQTHVNEHLVAVERSLVERGLRPIEHLHRAGALGPQMLLAHATLVTPSELMLLRRTDTAVAYNPVATQWKGNATAPALMMAELGIRFGLGTDGTRSDAFRLVDAAEATQRVAFGLPIGDFSMGAGWRWLDHALHDSAAAIGLGGRIGAIEPGLAADFLLIDLDVPEFVPSTDLVWELVRFGNRDQLEAVFVAGKLRLWRGWPPDWDARALMREVRERVGAAVAAAPIQRIHPVSMRHRAAHR
jgi:cytosine/adenosine deaminase-related metal-dependent hydrolase